MHLLPKGATFEFYFAIRSEYIYMFRESQLQVDVAYSMCMCMEMMHEMEHDSHNETPTEILKRRFALGEITKDQYEEMRRILVEEHEASHHH